MNNWPVFETRYEEDIVSSLPGYWESSVAAFIVLVVCSIGLIFMMAWRGRSQSLLLVTSRPHALSQPREYLPPKLFFPLSLLHACVMVGFTLALLMSHGSAMAVERFWATAGVLTGIFGLFIVVSTLMYRWMSGTFGTEDQRALWFPNHYLLIFLFGHSLYLPLACLLFTELSISVVIIVTLSLFLLFRGWSVARILAIFNQLYRYPLHIILYLCACEIGPLLFVINGSILSK